MGQLLLEILWVISYHLNEYWNPYNQEINVTSRFFSYYLDLMITELKIISI